MKIKTSDPERFTKYLKERSIKYSVDKEQIVVYATGTRDVLAITDAFKETIEDIEINKGTLNDVFIAITGKEIRE
jgi:ABC-2 type transport system ATP-binding protein